MLHRDQHFTRGFKIHPSLFYGWDISKRGNRARNHHAIPMVTVQVGSCPSSNGKSLGCLLAICRRFLALRYWGGMSRRVKYAELRLSFFKFVTTTLSDMNICEHDDHILHESRLFTMLSSMDVT